MDTDYYIGTELKVRASLRYTLIMHAIALQHVSLLFMKVHLCCEAGADPRFCARGVQNFARALARAQNSGFSLIIHDYVTALPLLASR